MDALLADVQLTHAQHVHAGGYSGGMRRRLSLALSLLNRPRVIYLDEVRGW